MRYIRSSYRLVWLEEEIWGFYMYHNTRKVTCFIPFIMGGPMEYFNLLKLLLWLLVLFLQLFLPSNLQPADKLWNLQVFPGHRQLLDSGLCDVVVVSSPNMTHFEILMDIINHHKPHHVLVEKPLCTTVEDCRKVRYYVSWWIVWM